MTNSTLIREIASPRNLYWAWEKAKWFFKPGDIWFDELEVSSFEANIDNELRKIGEELVSEEYKMSPIRPVAFPKKRDDSGTRTRQTFWVPVRDQVTWLAVMNVIGGDLDIRMPYWSYGNRVYISTFYEENKTTNKNELKFGFYRNTSKYTFRKWTQSWPLYRRHIYLTAKFLSRTQKDRGSEIDDKDHEAINLNDQLETGHPLKVEYITSDYWGNSKKDKLFWAGLDLAKFYPSVKNEAIEGNIRKYLKRADASFMKLINSLLDFKLDISQWTSDELLKVQLSSDNLSYPHLPTGLFVAGFLANVALLDVDLIVSRKLESNKKIAHFRYVDDHIILSSSFEVLIKWIEDYEDLLKKSGILMDKPFNPEKTEPKAIGDFFESKKSKDSEKIAKALELAREESELDPEFPSPLMTQTLSKVSRIAGTEFQLLDPEEQKGLIADVEHLLLTEFPDNELRRDTRIAFAARMLISLVPRVESSVMEIYEYEKKILALEGALESEKVKKEEKQNPEVIKEVKNQILSYQNKIKSAIQENDFTEKKLVARTIKLLKKSVRENHQKVRLWTRLIEFCFKSGGQIEVDVVNELNRLIKNNESNRLSNTFIQSLIVQVLTNQLIRAYRVVDDKSALYKSHYRACRFIKSILSRSLFDSLLSNYHEKSKFYETETFDAFRFATGTVIYLLKGHKSFPDNNWNELLQEYKLVDWNKSPEKFETNSSYSFEAWTWWITNKVNPKKLEPSILWYNSVEKINIESDIGRSLVLQFPNYLPNNVIEQIDRVHENYNEFNDEGWLYELYLGYKKDGNQRIPGLLSKIQKKFQPYEDHITLDEWIEWGRNLPKEQSQFISASFDPRRSEWMALELTKQIARAINEKVVHVPIEDLFSETNTIDTYARAIHPKNFKISKKILDDKISTWYELKTKTEKYNVSFVRKEYLIFDRRLNPMFSSFDFDSKIGSIITGLGAMLVLLLAKKIELPNKWNPAGHKTLWLGQMNMMLKNYPVSSYTRDIISGCFSKRNIETQILLKKKAALALQGEDDFKNDPPRFNSVNEFIDFIELSQDLLEKQQVSISENQPRQLIPISLVQMKSSNYQEKLKESKES